MGKPRVIMQLAFLIAVVLITGKAFVAQEVRIQRKTVDLVQMPLENVLLEEDGIAQLFSRFSFDYNIPVGLEIARGGSEMTLYRIELKKGTLSDLLTQFVTVHKEYAWKIENGVVSVFPKEDYRDPVIRELLETKIGSFSVAEKTTATTFGQNLLCSSEIKRTLERYGISYDTGYLGGFYIQQLGQHYSFEVSNMQLKSILDKVIKESPVARNWSISNKSSPQSLHLRVNARLEYSPKP